MRRHLRPTLALVLVDNVLRVDRQATVGVDDDAKQTRVRLKGERQTHISHTSMFCLSTRERYYI